MKMFTGTFRTVDSSSNPVDIPLPGVKIGDVILTFLLLGDTGYGVEGREFDGTFIGHPGIELFNRIILKDNIITQKVGQNLTGYTDDIYVVICRPID